MKEIVFILFCFAQLAGCSAEVGSEKWCVNLEEQARGDWTANEAGDYAKYCIFK